MIESGRLINEKMPQHVVELISDAFAESNQTLENSKILIHGISYKPYVKDIQLSPAKIIIKKLQDLGVDVYVYDESIFLTQQQFLV